MSSEEQKGNTPTSGSVPAHDDTPSAVPPAGAGDDPSLTSETTGESAHETHTAYTPTTDADPYGSYDGYTYDDPYTHTDVHTPAVTESPALPPAGGSNLPPPAAPPDDEEEEDDDDGMLRMSFLEHLEELRSRLIRALMGMGIAFLATMFFANEIWKAISNPAVEALARLGYEPQLVQLAPTDAFTTIWMKVPLLASVFLASPWVLYQIWAFISPGLYKKERRFAAPFIICTAGLFITGGLFAYFVAFRFGLEFLLGIGKDINVRPTINLVEYFDLFVNVTLGIGLIFEMPVVVFFLTFLRITTAKFLLEKSRYAILIIVILAAVVTPTPDIFNLMIFSVPMVFLYFVGVFASYLLELRRNDQGFPWASVAVIVLSLLALMGGIVYLLIAKYGYHLSPAWPFLMR